MDEPPVVFQWCPTPTGVTWWAGMMDLTFVHFAYDMPWFTQNLANWQGFWHHYAGDPVLVDRLMGPYVLANLWLPQIINGTLVNPPSTGWPP
jgi:hypothetical protein